MVKNPPSNAGNPWVGKIAGSEKSPGEGNGNPLQYSCLGTPMDRRALQATVHGVGHDLATKQQQLKHDRVAKLLKFIHARSSCGCSVASIHLVLMVKT